MWSSNQYFASLSVCLGQGLTEYLRSYASRDLFNSIVTVCLSLKFNQDVYNFTGVITDLFHLYGETEGGGGGGGGEGEGGGRGEGGGGGGEVKVLLELDQSNRELFMKAALKWVVSLPPPAHSLYMYMYNVHV